MSDSIHIIIYILLIIQISDILLMDIVNNLQIMGNCKVLIIK